MSAEASGQYTVNSEIFARVLFSRNVAYAKFRENKTREMARSFSCLLKKINNHLVANC